MAIAFCIKENPLDMRELAEEINTAKARSARSRIDLGECVKEGGIDFSWKSFLRVAGTVGVALIGVGIADHFMDNSAVAAGACHLETGGMYPQPDGLQASGITMAVHRVSRSMEMPDGRCQFINPQPGVFGHVNPDGSIVGKYAVPAPEGVFVCNELIDKDSCGPDGFVKEGTLLFHNVDQSKLNR